VSFTPFWRQEESASCLPRSPARIVQCGGQLMLRCGRAESQSLTSGNVGSLRSRYPAAAVPCPYHPAAMSWNEEDRTGPGPVSPLGPSTRKWPPHVGTLWILLKAQRHHLLGVTPFQPVRFIWSTRALAPSLAAWSRWPGRLPSAVCASISRSPRRLSTAPRGHRWSGPAQRRCP